MGLHLRSPLVAIKRERETVEHVLLTRHMRLVHLCPIQMPQLVMSVPVPKVYDAVAVHPLTVRHIPTALMAVKVTKILAVEAVLSLFSTDVLHNGVAAAYAGYGILFIAYSPIIRTIFHIPFASPQDASA